MRKKEASIAKPKSKPNKVRFNLYLPNADSVSLAGDFNNWDIVSLPMKKDDDGSWEANINLAPGRYQYRFLVNGAWHDDPNAHEMVRNPFGSRNCVRIVI